MAPSVMAELNVVVTGFSPWGSFAPLPNLPINTSWQIAKSLPRVIFRASKPNVRILTYPSPIKTSWETARETVPILWKANKSEYGIYVGPSDSKTFTIDAMVHLGMEDDNNAPFSIEKKAYKTKYEDPDVDNKTPSDDDLNGGGLWDKCPDTLETDLDIERVYKQVKAQLEDVNIRTSTNPGRYLCGYLYYSSLAALHAHGEKKRVTFVHVPPKHESEDIERGVMVITKLIQAIADQLDTTSNGDHGGEEL
ncbi:hypothetical protein NKR19_g9179 [Coniochaeta hoffmannii]|uniref:Peptidase C15, pyroglutamyl peptidase I-like protein n=1 Tax=Coniochaeta hoffmannii TaxID=91930 RepID=A0AA38RIP6_9PEZI|nr:hypothetical protein NKR19_g9179 [Coniochaeta hoffmannii]